MQVLHPFIVLLVLSCNDMRFHAAAEVLPWHLPGGVFLQKKVELQAQDREMIGQKLGGKVQGVTQVFLRVQGRPIQVNVITAADEMGAAAIHASLLKIKPALYCSRRGKDVFEYVGREIDDALARKTSYELGLIPKPKRVNYRIEAEVALVDEADYMACNPLFNEFLNAGPPTNGAATQPPGAIQSLAARFKFGRTLLLRQSALTTVDGSAARYSFQSATSGTEGKAGGTRFEFSEPLPARYGVPFVAVSLVMPVGDTGVTKSAEDLSPSLTKETAHWPVNNDKIKALAETITRGKIGNEAKANAIIEWLAPGRNIKYTGETGSRWGTLKILEQRFGHCWDFSDCFVTLSRAAGVPARQVAGWLYASSGHVWAEYYRPGVGWQQVDPTGAGVLQCGIYHIAYFTSEDGEMPIVYLSMPKIEITSMEQ
jgi:hypothetical protein